MVTHTLTKMAAGGIHDQLAGGFHRYSTDDEWLVPHFEKMLYDNAQLASVYLPGRLRDDSRPRVAHRRCHSDGPRRQEVRGPHEAAVTT
jgi:uncharacterized protein YyaL (SSP411 family)